MSHTVTASFLVVLVVGATSPSVHAEKRTTDRLADEADAIVVGEVQSGHQSGYSVVFALSIARTLKGPLLPGTTVNVSWGAAFPLDKDLRGNYGLWFLRKASGGQWTLLRVLQGSVPFEFAYFPLSKASSPASVSIASQPATVNDQIAVELTAAITSYTDPRQLFNLAYGLLGIGESALAPELYRLLRENPDPEIRFVGVTGLWTVNQNLAALKEIADNADLISTLHTSSLVESAIAGSLNADPSAIQNLGKLGSGSDADLQRSSAIALGYIHTRDALPFLAQLLNSSDSMAREAAMRGLSRFVDNLPSVTSYNVINGKSLVPQGPAPYRTPETDRYSLSRSSLGSANQAEYLQFWKSWWAENRTKLGFPGR